MLVDRLWPRGLRRHERRADEWLKEAAPSDGLRRWCHAHPMQWKEFRHRYLGELKLHRETLRQLAQRAHLGTLTLIYAANDRQYNNAAVLSQYLKLLKKAASN